MITYKVYGRKIREYDFPDEPDDYSEEPFVYMMNIEAKDDDDCNKIVKSTGLKEYQVIVFPEDELN